MVTKGSRKPATLCRALPVICSLIAGLVFSLPSDTANAAKPAVFSLNTLGVTARRFTHTREPAAPQATPSVTGGLRFTCGLKSGGSIGCWGENDYGQLNAPSGTSFTQVSAGDNHVCALKTGGTAECWGDDFYGQHIPITATNLVQVSAAEIHTCAVTGGGAAACWGDDTYEQVTVPVSATTGVVQVAAGPNHTCARKVGGSLVCWGDDTSGQTVVPTSTLFSQVAVGLSFTCAIRSDGSLACWGENDLNQASPPAGNDFTQLSAGRYHSCALKTNGSIACWGNASFQQTTPAAPNSGYTQVGAGGTHACGVRTDNTLSCWGNNFIGQAPVVRILPLVLSGGVYDAQYQEQLLADGGSKEPYTLSMTSGTLPAGITFNASTGLLSGRPSVIGDYPFAVRAIDANNIAGSRNYTLTVVIEADTTTTLATGPNPASYGQTITFTARVTSTASLIPQGIVTFTIDSNPLTQTLNANGLARYITNTLSAGSHAIIARYKGDGGFHPSTSLTVTQVVSEAPISDLIAVNSSPTPLGQATVLTATAAGSSISYTWSFGDGAPVTRTNPASHIYPQQGLYTATVTATNSLNTVTARTVVVIRPAGIYLPILRRGI